MFDLLLLIEGPSARKEALHVLVNGPGLPQGRQLAQQITSSRGTKELVNVTNKVTLVGSSS